MKSLEEGLVDTQSNPLRVMPTLNTSVTVSLFDDDDNSNEPSPIPSTSNEEVKTDDAVNVIQLLNTLSPAEKKNYKILDSGAGCGVKREIDNKSFDVRKCKGRSIAFGGESEFTLEASHTCKTNISDYDLVVRNSKIDIVSISQADRRGFATIFFQGNAAIWSPLTGMVYETATLRDGLYHVDETPRFIHLQLDLKHLSNPQ